MVSRVSRTATSSVTVVGYYFLVIVERVAHWDVTCAHALLYDQMQTLASGEDEQLRCQFVCCRNSKQIVLRSWLVAFDILNQSES